MGLPFTFAHHFARGPNTLRVFEMYRSSFTPSVILREPHAMVSVFTLVADSTAEAERLALPNQAIGDLGVVTGRIDDLAAATGADKVIIAPQGPDLLSKTRTLRELGRLVAAD